MSERTILDVAADITVAALGAMQISPASMNRHGGENVAAFFDAVLQGAVKSAKDAGLDI